MHRKISWALIAVCVVCSCGNDNTDESFYDILEIKKTATQAEIKKAYRLIE